MKQPFSPKHIKYYVLFYAAVIVVMIAFYFINSSVNPARAHETKHFDADHSAVKQPLQPVDIQSDGNDPRFKLLPK